VRGEIRDPILPYNPVRKQNKTKTRVFFVLFWCVCCFWFLVPSLSWQTDLLVFGVWKLRKTRCLRRLINRERGTQQEYHNSNSLEPPVIVEWAREIAEVQKTSFLAPPFYTRLLKIEHLSRQARDQHRNSAQKRGRFLLAAGVALALRLRLAPHANPRDV
jgi:hypothetical protein